MGQRAHPSDSFNGMLGRTGAGLALLAALATHACGGSDATSPTAPTGITTPPPTFTLSGSITYAASAAPLPGAQVEVTDGPNAGRATTTGDDGRYTLSSLTADANMTVRASNAGFLDQLRTLSLTGDTVFDFSLAAQAGVVAGRVTDILTDAPVSGIPVEIPVAASTTTTGPGGDFTLPVDRVGQVDLLVGGGGSYFQRETKVFLGAPITNLNLTIIPDGNGFDLDFFDHVFRLKGFGATRRWVDQPVFEVWTSLFSCREQTGSGSCAEMVASDEEASAAFNSYVRAVLEREIGELTGNALSGFSMGTRSHAPGTVVTEADMFQGNVVAIAQVTTDFTELSWARWRVFSSGEMMSSIIQMNPRHNTLGCVYSHEIAHGLGYSHPDGQFNVPRPSVMNCDGVTAADQLHGRVLYLRPPGSRSPDKDPEGFVVGVAPRLTRGVLTTDEAP